MPKLAARDRQTTVVCPRITTFDGVITVTFIGPNDLNEEFYSQTLGAVTQALQHHEDGGAIVLDLANVEYISSPAIGRLIGLRQMDGTRRRHLVLCNVDRKILYQLQRNGMEGSFKIKGTQQDALNHLDYLKNGD